MVDIILGEGGDRLWPLPKRQVAVVGFTDHQVMQLLWTSVLTLSLEERMQEKQLADDMEELRLSSKNSGYLQQSVSSTCRFSGPSMTLSPTTTFILGARL